MQKGYQKMVEWYGDKESALKVMNNPPSKEVCTAFTNRVEDIEKRLSQVKHLPAESFEVKQLIGEYGFVMKRFCQIRHEHSVMLSLASSYRSERARSILDQKYGKGTAEFFAEAIEAFYRKQN